MKCSYHAEETNACMYVMAHGRLYGKASASEYCELFTHKAWRDAKHRVQNPRASDVNFSVSFWAGDVKLSVSFCIV